MAKSARIRTTFLMEKGLEGLMESGTAMPMMKRKEGNMRSAGVSPFHSAWSKNQGGEGPWLSTRIMPSMVSPRSTSSEFSLCLTVGFNYKLSFS